jgi:hypothetical protein
MYPSERIQSAKMTTETTGSSFFTLCRKTVKSEDPVVFLVLTNMAGKQRHWEQSAGYAAFSG